MTKALEGIRVLDLSQFEAGPSCAETLAWLGADVIKIEPPGGEQSRRGLSERPDIDAVFFCLLNCNKRAITLNLKTDRGKQMFTELVKTADVVLENLGPGSMERLGFGYDDLAKINPRIISASVKGFGSTGPYASYNSFEMIAQAMGGVMALTGEKDGPPLRVEAGLGDTGSGLHTAIGILAAIVQRQVTGVGQRIEVAQMDVVINLARIHFRDYYLGVDPIPRKGNRSPQACPSNTYRCKPFGPNDYVFVHTSNNEMWKALTKVLGRPEMGDDPKYLTREGRMAAQAELEAMVEQFCSTRTKHEVMELMGQAGVACGAVLDSTEIMHSEHLRQRGMVVDIEHPDRGKMPMLGSPIRMSASPVDVAPAPLLGEHNAEIYGKILGLNEEDLAALKRDKVI